MSAAVSFQDPVRGELHRRLTTAVRNCSPAPATPIMVVDLDTFDRNADDLARRADGKPVRVASKSLRVPALIRRALAHPAFSGVLGFTAAEAIWLVEQGITDDVVVAYPTVDGAALARITGSERLAGAITLMVDDPAHLDLIDQHRTAPDIEVRICLDVDAALDVRLRRLGPRRSPVRDAAQAADLARAVTSRPGFRLVGVMTYEGQVAGLQDRVPGQRAKGLALTAVKRASVHQLAERRAEVAEALRGLTALEFWNAGGSGSVETTVGDPTVTEVAAGSGLLVPTSFDHFASFAPHPAAFFGVPVTRRTDARGVTVHGGGLVASGVPGPDRLPTPWLPEGIRVTGMEGTGEVQTPLVGPGTEDLSIGDLVWFRHTKSGELFEHTHTAHLLAGDVFVDHVPTYRGEGLAF